MLTERLQILVTPEQRSMLEREARRRDISIGQLIRDAVEADLGLQSRSVRHEALEKLFEFSLPDISVEEMETVIDEQLTDESSELTRAAAPGRADRAA